MYECGTGVLTIVRVVEINNALPAIVLDGIDNRLMIIRTHADSEIQETRRRRKHLKVRREELGRQGAQVPSRALFRVAPQRA